MAQLTGDSSPQRLCPKLQEQILCVPQSGPPSNPWGCLNQRFHHADEPALQQTVNLAAEDKRVDLKSRNMQRAVHCSHRHGAPGRSDLQLPLLCCAGGPSAALCLGPSKQPIRSPQQPVMTC